MKGNTEPLKEQFQPLENRMKALYDSGIAGAELKNIKDEVAVLIFANSDKLLYYAGEKIADEFTQEDKEDLIADLIVLFYDKYDVNEGELYPFLQTRLGYLALDKWRKGRKKIKTDDPNDNQQEDQENEEKKPRYQKREFSLEKFTRSYEDSGEDSEYIIPDDKEDQERDTISQLLSDEAFLNLAALVTRFFEERDRRSGTQEGFRYYKAAYTKSVIDYVKGIDMVEPPEFQHEADIVEAADEAFANFVTLYQPYSIKDPLAIRKIFFNDLEFNRAVYPSYGKNEYPDERIAVPMKPFVIGGFMERVHHMKVSPSLVSQQMSRYKDDAAEVMNQIGVETGKRWKNRKKAAK